MYYKINFLFTYWNYILNCVLVIYAIFLSLRCIWEWWSSYLDSHFWLQFWIRHKKMDLCLWYKDQKWNLELYLDELLSELNCYLNCHQRKGGNLMTRIEIFSFGYIEWVTFTLDHFYLLIFFFGINAIYIYNSNNF